MHKHPKKAAQGRLPTARHGERGGHWRCIKIESCEEQKLTALTLYQH